MTLRIRLSRGGAKKRPFYRIVVADSRSPRDGRFIERIGTYNPLLAKDDEQRVTLNQDRVKYWLGVGARPSDRVTRFLGQIDLVEPAKRNNPIKGQPHPKTVERRKAKEEAASTAAAAPPPVAEAPEAEAPEAEAAAEETAAAVAEEEQESEAEAEAPEAEAAAEEIAAAVAEEEQESEVEAEANATTETVEAEEPVASAAAPADDAGEEAEESDDEGGEANKDG